MVSRALADAHARQVGWYATDPRTNTFPRQPVREGENVLVAIAVFDDRPTAARFSSCAVRQGIAPALERSLARPSQALLLAPTERSALRA